jgi:hypothetical protein
MQKREYDEIKPAAEQGRSRTNEADTSDRAIELQSNRIYVEMLVKSHPYLPRRRNIFLARKSNIVKSTN